MSKISLDQCSPFKRSRRLRQGACALALLAGVATAMQPAAAGSFEFFGIDTKYTLVGTYALATRLEEPSNRVIDTVGRPEIPIPEALKFPESNNFDDGDRNFDQYALVNNRGTLLGDIEFKWKDYGVLLRGDAFYDDVYNRENDNEAPERLNTRQEPFNSFTDAADEFSGERARLLDAYAYGNFFFGDNIALNLRVGQHIAAWGQSLFFSGVALAQSRADATKATVPGADVKSILLPTNQVSARLTLTDKITLLGQYKFEFEPTELNPTGEFFSVADIIGPGAEFAYGIRNPLFLPTLSGFDLTDPDELAGIADVLDQLFLGAEPDSGQLVDLVGGLVNNPLIQPLLDTLPTVNLPNLGNLLNAPRGINVERGPDTLPEDGGQWGLGLEYALNFTTTLGFYYLDYASTNPTVRQNFGDGVLLPANALGLGIVPEINTGALDLQVPVTYSVEYFDDITLKAASFSTNLFGINFGGEYIERDGIDVLVDVDNGVLGPVPTPARADSRQILLNGIYTTGPRFFWEALTIVGEVGYIEVDNVQGQPAVEGPQEGELFDQLTFDEDAAAFALLAIFDRRKILPGWDMRIPISIQGAVKNRSPVAGAFGSLLGEDDYRIGIGVEFTRLQKLTLGLQYSGFTGGEPDFDARPLQDRDTLAFTAKYNFF